MRKSVKISSAIVAAVTGLGILTVSGAQASIPSADGTVHACYTTTSGSLRVVDVDSGGSCYSYETSVSWPTSVPSLKYFTGTVTTGSQREVSLNCPDGGLPVSLWVNGHSVTSGDSHLVATGEFLNFPAGDDYTGTVPPIGINGYGPSTSPNALVNYALICT